MTLKLQKKAPTTDERIADKIRAGLARLDEGRPQYAKAHADLKAHFEALAEALTSGNPDAVRRMKLSRAASFEAMNRLFQLEDLMRVIYTNSVESVADEDAEAERARQAAEQAKQDALTAEQAASSEAARIRRLLKDHPEA